MCDVCVCDVWCVRISSSPPSPPHPLLLSLPPSKRHRSDVTLHDRPRPLRRRGPNAFGNGFKPNSCVGWGHHGASNVLRSGRPLWNIRHAGEKGRRRGGGGERRRGLRLLRMSLLHVSAVACAVACAAVVCCGVWCSVCALERMYQSSVDSYAHIWWWCVCIPRNTTYFFLLPPSSFLLPPSSFLLS